jgi:hypothetical protein
MWDALPCTADAGDCRRIANEIEAELVEQCRVDGVRPARQKEHIAVRWSTYERLGADIGGSTRPVLYNERLPEPF